MSEASLATREGKKVRERNEERREGRRRDVPSVQKECLRELFAEFVTFK
jgi:hypothetical protein